MTGSKHVPRGPQNFYAGTQHLMLDSVERLRFAEQAHHGLVPWPLKQVPYILDAFYRTGTCPNRLRTVMAVRFARSQPFFQDRQERNKNHDANDPVDLLFNIGNGAAQKITAESHPGHPGNATHDIVSQKLFIRHPPHAGHGGREGTDNGHETRDHDGLVAVFLVKSFCPRQVIFVEKERVLPVKYPRPQMIAYPIADTVTADGCDVKEQIQVINIE